MKLQPRPNVGKRSARAAVALRLAGADYSEIATTLGYPTDLAARRAIEDDLAVDADLPQREDLRTFEALRLDALLKSVWPKATDPGNKEHILSVKAAVSIIDRRIRLLGLDAPEEVIIHTPATAELDAWVAQVIATENGQDDDPPLAIEG